MKKPSLQLFNRKPKWYQDAQWRLDRVEGAGFIYLPHAFNNKIYYYSDLLSFDIAQAALTELNKLSKWQNILKLFPKVRKKPVFRGTTAFDLALAAYKDEQLPKTIVKRRSSRGQVVKGTKPVEFDPKPRTGGRIVKAMPRQLQKIKQAQEKIEKDELPKIED